jgi:hypothetical protein
MPDAHWIRGWVAPGTGLDVLDYREISSPAGIRTPDRPAPNLVTVPTTLFRLHKT